jgi:hypothetical protein
MRDLAIPDWAVLAKSKIIGLSVLCITRNSIKRSLFAVAAILFYRIFIS